MEMVDLGFGSIAERAGNRSRSCRVIGVAAVVRRERVAPRANHHHLISMDIQKLN